MRQIVPALFWFWAGNEFKCAVSFLFYNYWLAFVHFRREGDNIMITESLTLGTVRAVSTGANPDACVQQRHTL